MSQYSGFNHLDGASGYNLDLDDDHGSVHSSTLTTASIGGTPHHSHPHAHPHQHSHQHQHARLGGDGDVESLNFDELSLDSLGQGHTVGEQMAANLYEDDFEGVLDDMTRELPPHACRSVGEGGWGVRWGWSGRG